jgi:hypothetical protein
MALYEVLDDSLLTAPALISALNGWVDAGLAGTTAAGYIGKEGEVVVRFDVDEFVDYRARRPTLDIDNGVLSSMAWTELTIKRVRTDRRDLLVLTGPEPDYRWRRFRQAMVEIAERLGVVESVSLGAIGATVPHTHATPLLITGAERGSLESDLPLPAGTMQVPASALNIIEIYLAERGIRSIGIWAQVPHYVEGVYFAGALALVERAAGHLGVHLSTESLVALAREQRTRLDAIVAERPDARAYLDQLEENGPLEPLPPGEDIASELERFLREATGDGHNPFETPPDDA